MAIASKKIVMHMQRFSLTKGLLLACFLILSSCATPIGVSRVTPEEAYQIAHRTPLSGDENSNAALAILQRHDLSALYEKNPGEALSKLYEHALKDDRRDILFALAELYYSWAKTLPVKTDSSTSLPKAADAYLQSAIYAYLFLLSPGSDPLPNAYDNRFREACDLYNNGVAQGFLGDDQESLEFTNGTRSLPNFNLKVDIRADQLRWKLSEFDRMMSANAFDVFGLTTHNRNPGLGAPILGQTRQSRIAPNGGVTPITALLRINGDIKALSKNEGNSTLELISSYDDTEVVINGQTIPLQSDTTTSLAYRLNDKDLWKEGLTRFIFADSLEKSFFLIQAYQPGKIPVVLVHGTGSSPVWWAEMVNSLRADPLIRSKFQFWFYEYTSSQPILSSASDLRDTLQDLVKTLDPNHTDPAMQQLVVIGHSQGGLLTHMTAIDSKDVLWKTISDKPFGEFKAIPQIVNGVHRGLFFDHLPFVKRVVFISTPHRGSFLTEEWVRKLAHFVIHSPTKLMRHFSNSWQEAVAQLKIPKFMHDEVPTAVDGMNRDNPIMEKVAELPFPPEIRAHSIIAVLPDMDIKTGNDGVVEYKSAHLDGVDSEFIVRTGHSAQGHPLTIEEVRRILHVHCGELPEICGPAKNY